MVFDLGTLSNVTLISLAIALSAIIVTLLAYYLMRRQMSEIRGIEKSIDAYAVVQEFSQRSKKLEERLIDQKVRLEILELRQQRSGVVPSTSSIQVETNIPRGEASIVERPAQVAILTQAPKEEQVEQRVEEGPGLVRSELEALHVVFESGANGASAKQIQSRIGRSREHTARMMNSLFKRGLVERHSEVRPFTYTLTAKGKDFL